MKMSNAFSADTFCKTAMNSLPGQVEPPPPPTEINGGPEYTVSYRILASRIRNRIVQYKAEYDADGFINSASKVKEFHEGYPD